MSIKVCNKHFHKDTEKDIYIARPSIFGNPWSHLDSNFPESKKVDTRLQAVNNYLQYFLDQYKNNNEFKEIIDAMVEAHLAGEDMNLVCYCAPYACHGDIIKKFIEHKASKKEVASINELEKLYKEKE